MQAFRDLKVWVKSHELCLEVYRATRSFPREEQYGLTRQLRRAAASIAAIIAEGCGRSGGNELRRYLEIAMGSASELEYHLLLGKDLDLLSDDSHLRLHNQVCEVKKMLTALI